MKVKSITLENMRAFEKATFEFGDGMNLIVGVNGVGKSTVLDALRFAFSRVLPKFSVPVGKQKLYGWDIRNQASRLKINLVIEVEGADFTYNLDFPRVQFKPVSFDGSLEPSPKLLQLAGQTGGQDPPPLLALYFSPRRSTLVRKLASKTQVLKPTAFARALLPRSSNLGEFTDWWMRLDLLPTAQNKTQLLALQHATSTFLDGYQRLRPGGVNEVFINKGKSVINVRHLSDGERSILALVIELTRRLSLANPELKNPSEEASAVVLIDELDLHLHPNWQRQIVDKLTRTFPKCQFICTTHSPQIIGEVEPEHVSFIEDGEVFNQAQTLGLSSEWIIEHLMGTSARNEKAKQLIELAERNLEEGHLDEARKYVKELRTYLRGPDGVVVRLNASINSLESVFDEQPTARKKRPSSQKKK